MNMHDKNVAICNKEQRCIQNSVEHLRGAFCKKPSIIFKKSFILDVRLGSEYASEVCNVKEPKNITADNLFCIVTHHCAATYGIGLLHMCDFNFGRILTLNIRTLNFNLIISNPTSTPSRADASAHTVLLTRGSITAIVLSFTETATKIQWQLFGLNGMMIMYFFDISWSFQSFLNDIPSEITKAAVESQYSNSSFLFVSW